jgi:EpsI family protein
MPKNKSVIVLILLGAALLVSFGLAKPKYQSPDMLSKLNVPSSFNDWQSKDASSEFNPDDLRYNFISRIFARDYTNKSGENLLFLILDAGNFHNPKVCYGASGFKITDLPIQKFEANNRIISANAVFFEKPDENYVIIYWICINKKVVDWTQQKWLQLWYSLFNKQKVGLMARLDIPADPKNIDSALKLAKEFISQISSHMPPDQSEYLFGE